MALFAWGHHGVQLRLINYHLKNVYLLAFYHRSSSAPGGVTIGNGRIIAAACGAYHIVVVTEDGLLRSLHLGGHSNGETCDSAVTTSLLLFGFSVVSMTMPICVNSRHPAENSVSREGTAGRLRRGITLFDPPWRHTS